MTAAERCDIAMGSMPRNILVTGGCGFIGSHFVTLTLQEYPDAKVVNLDAMTYAAHPDTSAYLEKIGGSRYKFIKADIASPEIKNILVEHQIDSIVNFAAESHVDRSILDPASFVRTNVLGLQNMLAAAREAGKIRFVHVSTDEVYGSLAPNDPTSLETSLLDPNSPYAASKAAADLMAIANQRTYKQDVLITRCTNNYGPFQFPEKLLPLLITNAVEDKPIPVYGDGQQIRDWIHVMDHARGVDLVLRKGRTGEIYNISASSEKPNLEIIRKVLDLMGKPHSLIQYVGDRPAHDRRYGLNATKIRKELGWAPKFSLDEGLKGTVEWYVREQEWWKKVRDKEYFKFYQSNYVDKVAKSVSV